MQKFLHNKEESGREEGERRKRSGWEDTVDDREMDSVQVTSHVTASHIGHVLCKRLIFFYSFFFSLSSFSLYLILFSSNQDNNETENNVPALAPPQHKWHITWLFLQGSFLDGVFLPCDNNTWCYGNFQQPTTIIFSQSCRREFQNSSLFCRTGHFHYS